MYILYARFYIPPPVSSNHRLRTRTYIIIYRAIWWITKASNDKLTYLLLCFLEFLRLYLSTVFSIIYEFVLIRYLFRLRRIKTYFFKLKPQSFHLKTVVGIHDFFFVALRSKFEVERVVHRNFLKCSLCNFNIRIPSITTVLNNFGYKNIKYHYI